MPPHERAFVSVQETRMNASDPVGLVDSMRWLRVTMLMGEVAQCLLVPHAPRAAYRPALFTLRAYRRAATRSPGDSSFHPAAAAGRAVGHRTTIRLGTSRQPDFPSHVKNSRQTPSPRLLSHPSWKSRPRDSTRIARGWHVPPFPLGPRERGVPGDGDHLRHPLRGERDDREAPKQSGGVVPATLPRDPGERLDGVLRGADLPTAEVQLRADSAVRAGRDNEIGRSHGFLLSGVTPSQAGPRELSHNRTRSLGGRRDHGTTTAPHLPPHRSSLVDEKGGVGGGWNSSRVMRTASPVSLVATICGIAPAGSLPWRVLAPCPAFCRVISNASEVPPRQKILTRHLLGR